VLPYGLERIRRIAYPVAENDARVGRPCDDDASQDITRILIDDELNEYLSQFEEVFFVLLVKSCRKSQ
jgi:hypothetical protein